MATIAGAAGGGGGAAALLAVLVWCGLRCRRQGSESAEVAAASKKAARLQSYAAPADDSHSAGRAAAPSIAAAQPAARHRVRALVVGCGTYTLLEDLDNPPHDAAAVAAILEAAGAEVLLLLNPTRDELDKGLRTLSDLQRKPFPQACAPRP